VYCYNSESRELRVLFILIIVKIYLSIWDLKKGDGTFDRIDNYHALVFRNVSKAKEKNEERAG
jgi:hypothetical protein